MKNFMPLFEALLIAQNEEGLQPSFDLKAAVGKAECIAGHESLHA